MGYVATIGFFDGVHLGHRFLIDCLLHEAASRGLDSAILTFEQHPESVLRGTNKPLLTTFEERTERLKQCGVTEIFCFNFEVIQMMTAAEFMRILVANCDVRVLLMGYDHHFGSDALPSFAAYQEAAAQVGLTLLPIGQAPEGDVSSSKIRRALQRGSVESANIMLGYSYTLTGTVVRGRGIGREIGFPTANISVPDSKLLPANGVYEVLADVHGDAQSVDAENVKSYPAILNIGTNPTIGQDNGVTLEVHLPRYSGDLYGRAVSLHLISFIREERRFDSLEQLREQIQQDVALIASYDALE